MRFLVAAALLAAASAAAGQVYRWTDSSGNTHFTDTRPPASARDVREKRGASPVDPEDAGGNMAEPYALQLARKNYPLKLYSTPDCGAPCDEARALLNARGVPFTEVSVSNELTIAELKEASGTTAVPTLLVGTSVQKGFEQGAYHASLDAAGYPRTGILPQRNQRQPKEADASAPRPLEPSARGPYAPRSR